MYDYCGGKESVIKDRCGSTYCRAYLPPLNETCTFIIPGGTGSETCNYTKTPNMRCTEIGCMTRLDENDTCAFCNSWHSECPVAGNVPGRNWRWCQNELCTNKNTGLWADCGLGGACNTSCTG
ncbi:hypothetical protein K491DRAFT_694457 [Lophiostoma macrostomum CBS 122681]|uniref:Uncharacterized protein n=1 Tax=Lophiostoma macrostomum CBS 122681 TaxID=1314788 RepID=A0A6A6T151_9PLEO|nr:hypothetical protein K491DRAFT_694457 [Lophiostoma macrostomum CBS 122681]